MQVARSATQVSRPLLSRLGHVLSDGVPLAWWPVAAALVVQCKVLANGFLFDDFVHLYNVSNLPFTQAVGITMGGHMLHSFIAVVWLVKHLFGAHPFAFLLLALMAHLASVRLLFEIISRLTQRAGLAAFGATLWGISPFASATLGWMSVNGQAYATAIILWVLLDIVRCSQQPAHCGRALLIRHAVLLPVAATSFGTGLVCALVMPLVVALWNPVPGRRLRLVAVYGAVALAAIALYAFTMTFQGEVNDDLASKLHLVGQGFEHLSAKLGTLLELLSIGISGLLGGPLLIGRLSPVPAGDLPGAARIATVFVVLPLVLLGLGFTGRENRLRICALFVLPVAAYGLIALARTGGYFAIHTDAPRYHYLPPAVLTIIGCLLLSRLIDRLPARVLNRGRAAYLAWLALVIVPFALASVPVAKESQIIRQQQQYEAGMRTIRTAIQDGAGRDTITIVNKPFRVFVWGYTPAHFPGLAALFVMSYPENAVDGKPVLFLEKSADIVQMTKANKRARIAGLLVHAPDLAE